MAEGTEQLTLKWGTVKGWSGLSGRSVDLLRKYFGEDMPIGCMQDRPDQESRAVLCDLIDQLNGEIYNDWSGEYMSKDDAKKYVVEYGT